MRKLYEKPPLAEALCEVRFAEDDSWDLSIPGLVYQEIKGDFPDRRNVRAVVAKFENQPDGVMQTVAPADRFQCWAADKRAVVQIGPNVLIVNHLRPYTGWENFRPLIEKAHAAYCKHASPKHVDRIGLRYINRISFQSTEIDVPTFFAFYPKVGSALPRIHGPFHVRVDFPIDEFEAIVQLQLTHDVSPDLERIGVVLDIDCASLAAEQHPEYVQSISEWLEKAHCEVSRFFEGSITDAMRSKFRE